MVLLTRHTGRKSCLLLITDCPSLVQEELDFISVPLSTGAVWREGSSRTSLCSASADGSSIIDKGVHLSVPYCLQTVHSPPQPGQTAACCSSCSCDAGTVLCDRNNAALLYQTAQHSQLGISEVPPVHSCLEREQSWHKPRTMEYPLQRCHHELPDLSVAELY